MPHPYPARWCTSVFPILYFWGGFIIFQLTVDFDLCDCLGLNPILIAQKFYSFIKLAFESDILTIFH